MVLTSSPTIDNNPGKIVNYETAKSAFLGLGISPVKKELIEIKFR
jgi:hypothetical protein